MVLVNDLVIVFGYQCKPVAGNKVVDDVAILDDKIK